MCGIGKCLTLPFDKLCFFQFFIPDYIVSFVRLFRHKEVRRLSLTSHIQQVIFPFSSGSSFLGHFANLPPTDLFELMAPGGKGKPMHPSSQQDNRNELLGGEGRGGGGGGSNNNNNNNHGVNNPAYLASPSGGPPGGPSAATELEQIHLQINKTTDQSLDSTRRMVGLLEESQTVGAKTMENLYRQGEQLDKVEDHLDTMNQDLREAERNMEQMEKCCGLCVCPWRKRRNFEKLSGYQKTFGQKGGTTGGRAERDSIHMEQPNVAASNSQGGTRPQYINRITNDAREDEMEENLEAVGGMLGGLKSMATDMGREINNQNKALDRMNGKAEITNDRVIAGDKRAQDLLKRA
ncbi:putative Synaptosomal-associated protein 23 [Hypsibius exemplaris]|uniref:Synaptosomal-associated protein n=1 Tax=Hypsibius exemplaris TaxID=2072580 RepID=A0A1W0WX88_HYPEX|nr:putative Synaptosomal-associated protein 23 [Hypsibius exemplaris]